MSTETLDPKLDVTIETNEPPQYAIILHNDGSTSLILVYHILVHHLNIGHEEAEVIIFIAETAGKAPCGIYTKDIAETLVQDAMSCDAVMGSELTLTVEEV